MPAREVMPKFAAHQLHSGSKAGPVVTNRRQAIAIAASERDNEKKHGGVYVDHPIKKLKRRSNDSAKG